MKRFVANNMKEIGRSLPAIMRNVDILVSEFGYEGVFIDDVYLDKGFTKTLHQLKSLGLEGFEIGRNNKTPTRFTIKKLLKAGFTRSDIIAAWEIGQATYYAQIRIHDS